MKVYSPYIRRKLTGCLVFIGLVQNKQPAVLEKVGNPTYKGRQPAAQPPLVGRARTATAPEARELSFIFKKGPLKLVLNQFLLGFRWPCRAVSSILGAENPATYAISGGMCSLTWKES